MANLKPVEKKYFEDIFGMSSGYVLGYTNATFAELFRDVVGINISDDKYAFNGDSKAKRLRAFWELESDEIVGKVLEDLLEIWKYDQKRESKTVDHNIYKKGLKIVYRLLGKQYDDDVKKEEDFLKRDFEINLSQLNLTSGLSDIIEQRITEIQICLKNNASLAVIFLCGSVLEGLLLNFTTKYPQKFNTSRSAPKNKEGKIKRFHEWTLNDLINVAHEIGFLGLDIKKHSHSMRDFRNYMHPYQQMVSKFTPDEHTAQISWKVLQAAIADLSKAEE
ncbi:MAG: hypothetical protein EMLJLAPB_00369 [Candidatus Argoarchaeum ethanivorans]|uniref:DUF4145 domain-containing protein n=1 Tax=Candidatus Argoarchaeum ethanivorans TaxID=2608793 RepID=A0A811TAN9_9EURY|nr:MAG: hypothetical protein EMLJLAPB_00369 [Candidatus Argoarchaeum ethanivorans]